MSPQSRYVRVYLFYHGEVSHYFKSEPNQLLRCFASHEVYFVNLQSNLYKTCFPKSQRILEIGWWGLISVGSCIVLKMILGYSYLHHIQFPEKTFAEMLSKTYFLYWIFRDETISDSFVFPGQNFTAKRDHHRNY